MKSPKERTALFEELSRFRFCSIYLLIISRIIQIIITVAKSNSYNKILKLIAFRLANKNPHPQVGCQILTKVASLIEFSPSYHLEKLKSIAFTDYF